MLNWYDMRNDVLLLAHELSDYGYLPTKKEMLYFFEKPWKWTEEWNYFIANDNSMDGFDRRTVTLEVNKDE